MKKGGILLGIIILAALIGFYAYCKMTFLPDLNLSEIEIHDLNNLPINLADRHQKPLVINFWSTTSKKSFENLQQLNKAFKNYGDTANFFIVSDEASEEISIYKTTSMFPFFFIRSLKPIADYGIGNVPATYFFNAEGKMVYKKIGVMQQAEIERELSKLTSP